MTRVLFLVVAYNNHASVESFLSCLFAEVDGNTVDVAICDNSPSPEDWALPHAAVKALVARPDNPGYWGGALEALNAYVGNGASLPEWIILTNTDLRLVSRDMSRVLASHGDPDVPLVLAPRITEGPSEMNPHLDEARPRWRRALDYAATRRTFLAYVYLLISYFRSRTRRYLARWPGLVKVPAPAGSTMYSPYGAMVMFSRGFFSNAHLPGSVPIFAEEYAIAEISRRRQIPIVFEPRIHVEHMPHSTTGRSVSVARARMLQNAFKYIWFTSKGFETCGQAEKRS